MPPVLCALCFDSISRPSESLTTRASYRHSFHAECLQLKLKNKCRNIPVSLADTCLSCSITDVYKKKLLQSNDNIEDLNKWLTAVETKVSEAKVGISVADEMVLLRAACEQILNQFVVSGLSETVNEDVKLLTGALAVALESPLEPSELVDAFPVGKKARVENVDSCKKSVTAKKTKPNLTAKDVDGYFPDNRVYFNLCQPAQLYQLRDCVLKAFSRVERKHVWIADETVFMRKSADSRPIKILPSTDLQELSY
ncbi:hypothetical protein KQX54_012621 [Cotesia glomerata]|uniref:Uncharacterized protein n=1 Tax=Cotesia glomerata TaxID=32391 RepID=A0AAV7J7D5_COTGL|nr:hypothetical protein KQX54_012621 [Cotesia glomerata]